MSAAQAPALRAGISPCPNDLFVFSGWILGKTPAPRAAFFYEDIETLNGRARDGAYDLVKISYANVPRCPAYVPLDCGGALGRGCGPLLLTGGAAFDPEAEVLVPGERTTANFLLDFWFSGQGVAGNLRKRFVPFDDLYRELRERPGAQGVVIHEMRFTYARDGLRLVRDLGEHWENVTGGPIPLGAVVYRAGEGAPARPEIEAAIRASLDWARAHEREALELCALHAQDMEPGVMRSHIDLYVNAFTRELGEEGRAAVDYFLARLQGFRVG
jgi:1,4-dihydroxy-6-naphthoate synthase